MIRSLTCPPPTEKQAELLVSSQNDVGWDHWVQIQQDHIDHEHDVSSKKFAGQRWLKEVINHIWTHLCLAWKLRNADLHGVDSADQEAKSKAKLRPAIVVLCETGKKLNCLDRRICELPLLERLKLKSHVQAAWINQVTPTVRQAKAEADDKLQTTQRDIRKYFTLPAPAQPAVPRTPAEQARTPAEQARTPAEQARTPAEQAHARQPTPGLRDG